MMRFLMMKRKFVANDLYLYGVTDPDLSKDLPLEKQVEQAICGGATMIQLRDKNADLEQLCKQALKIKKITDRYDIPFVINDNVLAAKQTNVDGVHIGQDDVALKEAKQMLPKESIIGVSVQTTAQAIEAEKNGASYLGVGAMFATSTKTDAKLVSRQTLIDIYENTKIPIVIIGGINENNMSYFADTNIAGIAVVSALFGNPDIKSAAERLRKWRS